MEIIQLKKATLNKNLTQMIHDILHIFSNETGLAIFFFDSEGSEALSQHAKSLSPLCSYLKSHDKLWTYCRKDHSKRASIEEYGSDGKYKINMCHWGLYNVGYPIVHENKFYGCLLTGQTRLDSKEKLNLSEQQFNERVLFFLKNNFITPDEERTIRDHYNRVDKINNFHEATLNRLVNIEKNFITTLDSFQKRIQQIALLRHEIHDPNVSVSAMLEQTLDDLEIIVSNLKNIEERSKLMPILKKVKYAFSYSRLFSATIENIVNSINDDKLDICFKRENLINLINKAMYLFEEYAQYKNVKILPVEQKKLDVRNIEIDKGLIMRVLINAYQNAIKYSYTGRDKDIPRVVTTKCENLEKFFKISISSYGVGILKDEIDLVFNEGYRGKLAGERKRVGSGLGLYQIKKIVESHDGKVEITSKLVGTDILNDPYNTILSIYLPYYQHKRI
jgi:signal transduction histidine kinase